MQRIENPINVVYEAPLTPSLNGPEWLDLRIIRNRFLIQFEDPFSRKVTEEITLLNVGSEDIIEFPLPLPDYKNGLSILDEDGSIIAFLPRSEILTKLQNYDEEIQNALNLQMRTNNLLWIILSSNRRILSNETRIIRLLYSPSEPDIPSIQTISFFTIPTYGEAHGKGSNDTYETFYFIQPPKNFVVELIRGRTEAYDINGNRQHIQFYDDYNKPRLDDDIISVVSRNSFINIRLSVRNESYDIKIFYKILLCKKEHLLWNISLPLSWFLSIILILNAYHFIQFIPLNSTIVSTVSTITSAIPIALIALINNPLITRTRFFLLINIVLSVWFLFASHSFSEPEELKKSFYYPNLPFDRYGI